MKRIENVYEIYDTKVALTIGTVVVLFDLSILEAIKPYRWSHRGKGVIKNEFNETLCGRIATLWGFKDGEYTRRIANNDYTYENYTTREFAGVMSAPLVPVPKPSVPKLREPHDDKGVPRLERKRYLNKYQCETVTLQVKTGGTINVKINTFCRTYIPSIVRVVTFKGKQDIITLSGVPLRIWLQEELDDEAQCRSEYGKTICENPFDLRVDPNDLSYVSRKEDRIRHHYIEDGVVLELQENHRFSYFGWPLVEHAGHQFRIPLCKTRREPRRTFIIIDEVVLQHIDVVWYNAHTDEFMVKDTLSKDGATRPLKRLVCQVAGIVTESVYIAPRLNQRYKEALEQGFDFNTKAGLTRARRIARYENKLHTTNRGNMFTKPRYTTRRRILANKEYFCTEIYDGVGVWCLDMRASSLLLPGSTAPDQQHSHRKGVVE